MPSAGGNTFLWNIYTDTP